TTGTSSAWPSPSAVARPIRRPVNPPGPTPTTIRSTASMRVPAATSSPWDASSTRRPDPGSGASQSSATGASASTRARLGLAVAVSSAKVGNQACELVAGVGLWRIQQYQPPIAAQVAQLHLDPGRRQRRQDGIRPLHEPDRVLGDRGG